MKKGIRKVIRNFSVSMLVFTALSTTTVFADNAPNISVNGEKVAFTDAKPYVDNNGRTMVPIAKIAEIFDAETRWDGKTQKITIKNDFNTIELQIGKSEMLVDSKPVQLDTQPVMKNGRTYVPVKAISQGFGAKLGWNEKNNMVTLTYSAFKPQEVSAKNEKTSINVELLDNYYHFKFHVTTNTPVKLYFVVGKEEYMNSNNFNKDELKELVDNTNKNEYGIFGTENYFGRYLDRYNYDIRLDFPISEYVKENGKYVVKIFGITESGEDTELVSMDVNLIGGPFGAKLIGNNNSLRFNVGSNKPVLFYFIVGKADYMNSNNFSAEELKKLVDNTPKGEHGRFETENYFGHFNDRYFQWTDAGDIVPANVEENSEYIAKIFGVTESGEINGIVTMDLILKSTSK